MRKKRVFVVVGLVLLIGFLIFGATHRSVTTIIFSQGSGKEFLSFYPELMRQVNGWNQPAGQENVVTTDFYNVYTVTEKSLLMGSRDYHLLPFAILTMEDDQWQIEFRVLSDYPKANYSICNGVIELFRVDNAIAGTSLEMISDYRTEQYIPGSGVLSFEAWEGKKTQEPVDISFVPQMPETAEGENPEVSLAWTVSVLIGDDLTEMSASLYTMLPA